MEKNEVKKDERLSFSVTKGEKTCDYSIYPISNGYIVRIYEYGYEGKDRKYMNKTTETYFAENPLEHIKNEKNESKSESKKDKKYSLTEGLESALEKLNSAKGLIKSY